MSYTIILFMFRALTWPSSGGKIVFTQHLVSSLYVNGCTVHRLRADYNMMHGRKNIKLDIYIIILHLISLHVSVCKGLPSGNQSYAAQHQISHFVYAAAIVTLVHCVSSFWKWLIWFCVVFICLIFWLCFLCGPKRVAVLTLSLP